MPQADPTTTTRSRKNIIKTDRISRVSSLLGRPLCREDGGAIDVERVGGEHENKGEA